MTAYAYQKLFVKDIKKDHIYSIGMRPMVICMLAYITSFNLEDITLILNGSRYQCHFRTVVLYQCEHEFAQDGKLTLCKYEHRWLNDRQYDLANVGKNKDSINTSVALLDDDTTCSFEATTNNDKPYIINQGTNTQKSCSFLQKLGKDLLSCFLTVSFI